MAGIMLTPQSQKTANGKPFTVTERGEVGNAKKYLLVVWFAAGFAAC